MNETITTPRHIYTDGAAPNNQTGCKVGGLGVVIMVNGQPIAQYSERVLPSAGMKTTTNVRCEMLAVIKALELAEPSDIIHTDNQMIAKGFNEWLAGWKLKGWKNASKKPVANKDLWLTIDKLKQEKPEVTVVWVEGHAGIEGNELADSLATKQSKFNLLEDEEVYSEL